jgi:hypothetical protein
VGAAASAGSGGGGLFARVRGAVGGSQALLRIVYRDPEHVAERLTLYATERLGEPSHAWAEAARAARPDEPVDDLAHELCEQSAKIARVDGAVAGTPFFIALLPAYVNYLWQEARMSLRVAALYGEDPRTLETAADLLVLRGVHPTPEAASEALTYVREKPVPEGPEGRRPLRTWYRSVRSVLVFGGFLSAEEADAEKTSWLRRAFGFAVGGTLYLITWVLPVTFMIAMSWGCESHARKLGNQTMARYGGAEAAVEHPGRRAKRTRRTVIRGALLTLSVAVPIVFVAYVNHVRATTGVNWLAGVGALVALALVVAMAVAGSRR